MSPCLVDIMLFDRTLINSILSGKVARNAGSRRQEGRQEEETRRIVGRQRRRGPWRHIRGIGLHYWGGFHKEEAKSREREGKMIN